MRKLVFALIAFTVGFVPTAAHACGSLIAPNGAVRLVRTATFVAYHDGVEHYVTNFEFEGTPTSFGSIIPLPGRPSEAPEKAGDWTLQRLDQEVRPPVFEEGDVAFDAASAPTAGVEVLYTSQIDSLTVTVVEGGGAEVAAWAAERGFVLSDDAPAVLDSYSESVSPYFAAVEFDAELAAGTGVISGDGIPVQFEIPLDEPWVPLEILSVAKPGSEIVEADIYLLTDEEPTVRAGTGVVVARSEPASDLLLDDLRSDERMEWVPEAGWFTYLTVSTAARDLDFDLIVDPERGPDESKALAASNPSFADRFPGEIVAAASTRDDGGDDRALLLVVLATGVAVAGLTFTVAVSSRRR